MKKKTIDTICFSLLIACILMLLSQYLVILLLRQAPDLLNSIWLPWTAVFFSSCLTAFPAFFLLTRPVKAVARPTPNLPGKAFAALLVLGLCIVSCSFFLESALYFYIPAQPLPFDSPQSLVFLVLIACVLTPAAEELVFRRLLMDRLSFIPPRILLLFSALVFALFHMNPFQFIYSFLLGLSFGILYLCTGRLLYPLLLHILCNLWGTVFYPLLKLSLPYFPHKRLLYSFLALAAAAGVFLGLFSFLHPRGFFHALLDPPYSDSRSAAFPGKRKDPSEICRHLFLNPSLLIYMVICAAFMARS